MFKALYPRTIWLMFLSFSAIILCLALFRYWMPNQEDARYKVELANQLYAEANKLGPATKKKNASIQAVKDAEKSWLPYVADRTPLEDTAKGGININVNYYDLLLDTKRFRNSVQRAVNKQLLVGGVKVISGPAIPGVNDQDSPNGVLASYYNYPVVPFPVVIYDLGQVQIQGTYEQIMKNVRAWDSLPRYLAVTHGVQLQGTAPLLTATYNLTLVGYIRYDGIYGPVPDVPATGGATGGFGGPGGPGGAPGGAPGGIPGPSLNGATSPGGQGAPAKLGK